MNPAGVDMATMMALQNFNMTSQALDMMASCWDICYAKHLTREDIVSGAIHEEKAHRQRDTCIKRCMGRNFEVMLLQMHAQQERAQAMAAGGM